MNDQQVIVQYRVGDFGVEADLARRHQIEDLLTDALEASGVGICDGGDIGSGSMNIYVVTDEADLAQQLVVRTLRTHGQLDGAVVAVNLRTSDEDEYRVVWPEDHAGPFDLFYRRK